MAVQIITPRGVLLGIGLDAVARDHFIEFLFENGHMNMPRDDPRLWRLMFPHPGLPGDHDSHSGHTASSSVLLPQPPCPPLSPQPLHLSSIKETLENETQTHQDEDRALGDLSEPGINASHPKNARSMPVDSSEPPVTPHDGSLPWEVLGHTSTTTSANPNLAPAPTPEFCYKVVLKNPNTHIFDSSNLFFGSGGSLDPPDLDKCSHLTLTHDEKQFLEDVGRYLWGDKDFEDGVVIPMSLHEGLSLLAHTALSFPNSVYRLIFYDPDSDSSKYTTSDESSSDDDMNIYVDDSDSEDFKNTAPPHATSTPPLDSSLVIHHNIL
ncbi:unnamed protein product [Cyclocybe aegerita]|uniref:Uncharacterized protein n=1 Tax=Cyclocybe aegerita TaxID=1973307 RepID=A0A8S0XJ45_CYCAE|nr:unnamed protein product [Cyclocybe aegerita]